jgi:hypothetical protein
MISPFKWGGGGGDFSVLDIEEKEEKEEIRKKGSSPFYGFPFFTPALPAKGV